MRVGESQQYRRREGKVEMSKKGRRRRTRDFFLLLEDDLTSHVDRSGITGRLREGSTPRGNNVWFHLISVLIMGEESKLFLGFFALGRVSVRSASQAFGLDVIRTSYHV
jgi:hypothetical protein